MALTDFNTSDSLKTALDGHGYDTTIQDLYAFYDTTDEKAYTSMTTAFSKLVAVSHEGPRKLFPLSDTTLVRAWEISEIETWLLQNTTYESMGFSNLNPGKRCTLTVGGDEFTGDGDDELGALAAAFQSLLDDVNFDNYRA